MKAWTHTMFTMIGAINTVASGTKRPVTNAMPHSGSTVFTTGIRYRDASRPSLNVLIAPVIGGGSINPSQYVIEANRNSSPSRTRTTMAAILTLATPFDG